MRLLSEKKREHYYEKIIDIDKQDEANSVWKEWMNGNTLHSLFMRLSLSPPTERISVKIEHKYDKHIHIYIPTTLQSYL